MEELYHQTIQKMHVLAEMMASDDTEQRSHLVAEETPSEPLAKKDMAQYMMNWLRENFTNPYPDDEVAAQLAKDCGTTTEVIRNWLINARVRKWKPAIMKAFDANRPSKFLLEDSIKIFDGGSIESENESALPEFPVVKNEPFSGD